MKSRIKILLVCGLVILVFGSLFSLYGYNNTWKLWNIPTMSPHFADLRVILGGAESYARGVDPMIENPGDPWQRKLNYPRVWQNLYLFGVNQNYTTHIGIGLILLFLVGICLILPQANYLMIALVMAAVLSPATLLGVERGNTDLLMFFLVSFSVVAITRWPVLSAVIVFLGFVLKLYPICGCAVLLRVRQSLFLRYVFIILAMGTLYLFLIYSDLLLIRNVASRGKDLAYGLNMFWMRIMTFNTALGTYAKFFSYVTVLSAVIFAFSALLRNDFLPANQSKAVYLDAFRAGAAIYLGTFLLGINWDYRLMFLILTIPQLVIWTEYSGRYNSMGIIVLLSSIYASLWYLLIVRIISPLPHGNDVAFVVDEISHWVIFIGLLFLFFWSMPDWVRGYSKKIYFLTKRSA